MIRSFALALSIFLAFFSCSILATSVWAWANYGTLKVTSAMLRGEVLAFSSQSFEAGTIPAGEERLLDIQIFNMTGHPIEIFGFGSICGRNGCVSSDFGYPVVIESRSSLKIPLRYSGPKDRNEAFRLVSEIYTAVGTRKITITGNSSRTSDSFAVPIALRKENSFE